MHEKHWCIISVLLLAAFQSLMMMMMMTMMMMMMMLGVGVWRNKTSLQHDDTESNMTTYKTICLNLKVTNKSAAMIVVSQWTPCTTIESKLRTHYATLVQIQCQAYIHGYAVRYTSFYVAVADVLLLFCCCYCTVAAALLLLNCCCWSIAAVVLLLLHCYCCIAVVLLLLHYYYCCITVVVLLYLYLYCYSCTVVVVLL